MTEKKLNEFAIDHLVVSIYNKVATWNNKDYVTNIEKTNELKQVSFDIINEVAKEVFTHLEIPYNGEVRLDKEMQAQAIKIKEGIDKESANL